MKNRGFTLIELMIAVAILAIVSAIAIPAYREYVRESRLSSMRMNLDTLRIAVEAYRLDSQAGAYGKVQEYPKAAIAASYGWVPEGDNNAYDYVVRVTATTVYRICAGQPQASDTWVRCEKVMGGFACSEGTKGSTGKTASTACQ
jgi:prepilin-type N-terminal cleavage/methylation domain-containing protein